MAEQKPAATALAFELIAEELRQKALEDLFYFGVALPQARYTRRLEKLEDSKAQAEKKRASMRLITTTGKGMKS